MTDNEIIKALECHAIEEIATCELCPLFNVEGCAYKLARNSLDLINRQKAEIERYEKEHNENFNKWLILDERTKERYAELYEEAKSVVRAEAIKEFAERLDERMTQILGTPYTHCIIDNLVKEMVGDAE